ncbi:MAG: DNA polymerase III subunit gamma/tau [Candidatus Taylorbacteria bacterium]|nr:DNA polymerase III subunit gamma/tau [Candidatus Taylorbacteria bacterium]
MSKENFVALYRKYRPQSFKEVKGQDTIVKVLEGAIKADNISHAYLFAGSRGTGKTSIARIFAHAIGTSDNDIYEIDAASNRGIDDIREIRDAVNVLPFESKYKVYIIDEVHMLTKEAFNALLKTLEEPPEHAIFILATTETEKIPETIVSRCQVFAFKKPSLEVLRELVTSVAKKEGVTIEKGVADLIAIFGDGSFRDTLGTLQKAVAASKDDKISLAEIEVVLGVPKSQLVNSFIEALVMKNKDAALSTIATVSESGVSSIVFIRLVLEKTRALFLLAHAPSMKSALAATVSEGDFEFLEKLATSQKAALQPQLLIKLLQATQQMNSASIESLPLELAVIDICS